MSIAILPAPAPAVDCRAAFTVDAPTFAEYAEAPAAEPAAEPAAAAPAAPAHADRVRRRDPDADIAAAITAMSRLAIEDQWTGCVGIALAPGDASDVVVERYEDPGDRPQPSVRRRWLAGRQSSWLVLADRPNLCAFEPWVGVFACRPEARYGTAVIDGLDRIACAPKSELRDVQIARAVDLLDCARVAYACRFLDAWRLQQDAFGGDLFVGRVRYPHDVVGQFKYCRAFFPRAWMPLKGKVDEAIVGLGDALLAVAPEQLPAALAWAVNRRFGRGKDVSRRREEIRRTFERYGVQAYARALRSAVNDGLSVIPTPDGEHNEHIIAPAEWLLAAKRGGRPEAVSASTNPAHDLWWEVPEGGRQSYWDDETGMFLFPPHAVETPGRFSGRLGLDEVLFNPNFDA